MASSKITKEHFRKRGFSSHFATDPQELDPCVCYTFKNIEVFQPIESENDFIIELFNGKIITIKSQKEIDLLIHGLV